MQLLPGLHQIHAILMIRFAFSKQQNEIMENYGMYLHPHFLLFLLVALIFPQLSFGYELMLEMNSCEKEEEDLSLLFQVFLSYAQDALYPLHLLPCPVSVPFLAAKVHKKKDIIYK